MAILNEEAFEKLFTDWFPGLHTYACSILEDDADAEEAVQTVFCRIWERRETLSIPGSMKAYLYGSVYHACIDALRRRKSAQKNQKRQPETAPGADGKIELLELEKRYTQILDELPEQCRYIFQLSRFGELSYREIAGQLKISVKTVEAQMSKALKRLRTGLAEYDGTLLKPNTLQKAFEPHRLNDGSLDYDHAGNPDHPTASYGLGWFVTSNTAGDRIVYHGGYNYGASTMLYRNITRHRTILFFDNTNDDHFYKTMAIAAWLEGKQPPAQWAFAFELKRSAAREYGADLLEKGEDAALLHLLELKRDTTLYYVNRREISLVGYELLHAGRKDLGLAPFRINMLLFPNDAASFGNYGIVLAENGKKQEAIAVYRLALTEHPGDKTITELLKKQLDESR